MTATQLGPLEARWRSRERLHRFRCATSGDNYCENVQFRDTLAALGCGTRVTYIFSSGAPHQEAAWRGRSPAIFDLFEGN